MYLHTLKCHAEGQPTANNLCLYSYSYSYSYLYLYLYYCLCLYLYLYLYLYATSCQVPYTPVALTCKKYEKQSTIYYLLLQCTCIKEQNKTVVLWVSTPASSLHSTPLSFSLLSLQFMGVVGNVYGAYNSVA